MITFLILKIVDAVFGKRPETICFNCHGSGKVNRFACPVCDGSGYY